MVILLLFLVDFFYFNFYKFKFIGHYSTLIEMLVSNPETVRCGISILTNKSLEKPTFIGHYSLWNRTSEAKELFWVANIYNQYQQVFMSYVFFNK